MQKHQCLVRERLDGKDWGFVTDHLLYVCRSGKKLHSAGIESRCCLACGTLVIVEGFRLVIELTTESCICCLIAVVLWKIVGGRRFGKFVRKYQV